MQIKISNWKVKFLEHTWSWSRSRSLWNGSRTGARASKNSSSLGPHYTCMKDCLHISLCENFMILDHFHHAWLSVIRLKCTLLVLGLPEVRSLLLAFDLTGSTKTCHSRKCFHNSNAFDMWYCSLYYSPGCIITDHWPILSSTSWVEHCIC